MLDTSCLFQTLQEILPTSSLPPLRLLLSYYYFRTVDLDIFLPQAFGQTIPPLFIDSGAFSAATQQAPLLVAPYRDWLKRYAHWFTVMANLDVIGDAQATARHQAFLEDAGLSILPVFHAGEPWAVLERLLRSYSYIALGGMVPHMRQWRQRLMPWLVRCFKLADHQATFHGFGCTTMEIMRALPWRSVDSSTWGAGFMFGEVPLFQWERGILQRFMVGTHPVHVWMLPWVRRLGFDPRDFLDRTRNTRGINSALAVLSYRLMSAWLAQYWQRAAYAAPRGEIYLVEVGECANILLAHSLLPI
jgi:hypothetical protein